MKNTRTESNEKKGLKTVIYDHRYQILAGASCAVACVLGYELFKEKSVNKALMNENARLHEENKVVEELKEQVKIIQEAMSEGMIQEAIATVTRKINVRYDKRDRLLSKVKLNFKDKQILEKTEGEIIVFDRRLKAYGALEKKYYIEE